MTRVLVPRTCPYSGEGSGFYMAEEKKMADGMENMPDQPGMPIMHSSGFNTEIDGRKARMPKHYVSACNIFRRD